MAWLKVSRFGKRENHFESTYKVPVASFKCSFNGCSCLARAGLPSPKANCGDFCPRVQGKTLCLNAVRHCEMNFANICPSGTAEGLGVF